LKNRPLVLGNETGGLYLVDATQHNQHITLQPTDQIACLSISELWHCRLGHPSPQHMAHIQELSHQRIDSICSICPQAKQQRSSFPSSSTKANKMFELLHIDTWGPYRIATYDGFKLFLSIVDDFQEQHGFFCYPTRAVHSPC